MMVYRENDDYEPLAWARGVPIYATTLLVFAHLLALVGTLLAQAFGWHEAIRVLIFSSADAAKGPFWSIWQWFTYPFVHTLADPMQGLLFALEIYLFFTFGREVEKYIGRRHFLALYATLVLAPPAALTLLGLLLPCVLHGSGNVHFAVFVAFAVLYPGVEFFLRISARWLAAGLIALIALISIANHRWDSLAALLVDVGVAILYIQWLRGEIALPRLFRQEAVIPAPDPVGEGPRGRRKPTFEEDPVASIDPLLDKIASEGIDSLTDKERARLEEVRERLLNRSKR